jgi:hypothetical protein
MKIEYEPTGVRFTRADGTPMPLQDKDDVTLTVVMFFMACSTIGVNVFVDKTNNWGVWFQALFLMYICFHVRSKAIEFSHGFLPFGTLRYFVLLAKIYTGSFLINLVVAGFLGQGLLWCVPSGLPLLIALPAWGNLEDILEKRHVQ